MSEPIEVVDLTSSPPNSEPVVAAAAVEVPALSLPSASKSDQNEIAVSKVEDTELPKSVRKSPRIVESSAAPEVSVEKDTGVKVEDSSPKVPVLNLSENTEQAPLVKSDRKSGRKPEDAQVGNETSNNVIGEAKKSSPRPDLASNVDEPPKDSVSSQPIKSARSSPREEKKQSPRQDATANAGETAVAVPILAENSNQFVAPNLTAGGDIEMGAVPHSSRRGSPRRSPRQSPRGSKQNSPRIISADGSALPNLATETLGAESALQPPPVAAAILSDAPKVEEGENLGDDFQQTPWLPPSLDKAKFYKSQYIYHGGKAPLSSVNVCKSADLALGANLYFVFLRKMGIYMAISTIFALPSIFFAFFGSGVAPQDQDAMGLFRYSLGNIGYDPTSPTYVEDATCYTASFSQYNQTCLHFGSTEIPTQYAGYIIMFTECIQVILFFLFLSSLKGVTESLEDTLSGSVCKVSDYSVMIRNLPNGTTPKELVDFLSNLYPLDKPDWRKRPPVEGARPVQDSKFSDFPGSWVADCVVHKKIGRYIAAFRNQQHIMDSLYHNRALMKLYSQGTIFAGGANEKKRAKAELAVNKSTSEFDQLMQKVLKGTMSAKSSQVVPYDEEKATTRAGDISSINADVVAAFVCFEYCESMARFLEDHARYRRFPWFLCYPAALKFKGRKLRVSVAPEPDEMVWENIEVSKLSKLFRQFRTTVFTFILVLVCFIVILQSTIYKNKFNAKIPDLTVCNTDIPTLYSYNVSSTYTLANMEFMRPVDNQTNLDNRCNQIYQDSFYVELTNNGNWNDIIGDYNFHACNSSNICPMYGETTFCPCISTTSTDICQSATCEIDPRSPKCTEIPASTFGACYCITELMNMLKSTSVADVMNKVKQQSSNKECKTFFINYSSASAMTYLAIFVTVFVNKYLQMFLRIFTKMESHSSIDAEQGSLMLKIFVSMYFNMAILVLIASGKVVGQPPFIKPAHVLQGSYSDFDASWYGSIGTYFITTFIIQAVSPLAINLTMYWVVYPLNRFVNYSSIKKNKNESIVRQQELNKLEVGPVFDVTGNQALLLALLFFMMTYATGLPITVPMSFITFTLFFYTDKLLLCRFFERPPQVGNRIMKVVLQALGFAGIMRMAVGCWMLGNPFILSPSFIKATASTVVPEYSPAFGSIDYISLFYISSLSNQYPSLAFIIRRVLRPNVILLFLLLIIIIVGYVISWVLPNLPIFWVLKYIFGCCCSKNNKIGDVSSIMKSKSLQFYNLQKLNHPYRQESAPFTGEYLKYVYDKKFSLFSCKFKSESAQDALSQQELDEGWKIMYQNAYKYKVKLWQEDIDLGNLQRKKFDRKFTYEIIADHGCNSYAIEDIPAYRVALTGLMEAAQKMASKMSQKQ